MKQAIEEGKKSFKPYEDGAQCGAIIVKDGKIIGKGHRTVNLHKKEKTQITHAEQAAIYNANNNVKGADLYVTLEPCFERGNQNWTEIYPPCSTIIPASGIERVIIGLTDKDPRTNGKGIKKLVESGVKVEFAYQGIEKKLFNLIQDGKFYTLRNYFLD
jgi:diaminohydroxyphosphoribosylaminopyrimidine deaminase/5-amino-6-(5-phosphoribosylamino)uracil reductase